MPEPYVTNERKVTPTSNMSIWSSRPMLKNLPDQNYYGRVVVEVWDDGERVFYNSDGDGRPPHPAFFQRAIGALRSPEVSVLTITPWSDEPAIGELTGQNYRGRVVIEVWDNEAVVAIAGSIPASDLATSAANRLLGE